MILDHDQCLEIVEGFYRAAEHPEAWSEAIENLVWAFDSNGGHLVIFDANNQALAGYASNFPAEITAEYEEHYATRDLRVQRMLKLPSCQPSTELTLLTDEEIRRDPLHQEFFPKVRVRHSLCSMGRLSSGLSFGIALLRSPKAGFYEKAEMATFGFLLRHLNRALRLQRLTQSRAADGAAMGLEALEVAVLLLDGHRRVIRTNGRAHAIFCANDGIALTRNRLQITNSSVRGQLECALYIAISGAPRSGSELLVPRPSGKRPYVVQVRPLFSQNSAGWHRRSAALVTVHDPEDCLALPVEALAETYDLTPAEAVMATKIGFGLRVEDYALEVGVALSTARWRMKRVLAKTETHSQAELTRLITLLSTKRRVDPSSAPGAEGTAPNARGTGANWQ